MARLTTKQLQDRNTVRKAFNRATTIIEDLSGTQAEQTAKLLLNESGIPYWKEKLTAKELDKIVENLTPRQLRQLKNLPTKQQALQKEYKKRGGKGLATTKDTTELVEDMRARYEMHEWIEENLQAIYSYEQEFGQVVSGDQVPTWDELNTMRNYINENRNRPTQTGQDIDELYPQS